LRILEGEMNRSRRSLERGSIKSRKRFNKKRKRLKGRFMRNRRRKSRVRSSTIDRFSCRIKRRKR
jgi:hypothetical protein